MSGGTTITLDITHQTHFVIAMTRMTRLPVTGAASDLTRAWQQWLARGHGGLYNHWHCPWLYAAQCRGLGYLQWSGWRSFSLPPWRYIRLADQVAALVCALSKRENYDKLCSKQLLDCLTSFMPTKFMYLWVFIYTGSDSSARTRNDGIFPRIHFSTDF